MRNWHRIVYTAHKHLSCTAGRTQTNASACMSAASSKGTVTRDGDNELAIQFIVITAETVPAKMGHMVCLTIYYN